MYKQKPFQAILLLCVMSVATISYTSCGSGSSSTTTTDSSSAAPAMQDTSKMTADTSKMMMDTTKMDTAKPRPIENPPRKKP